MTQLRENAHVMLKGKIYGNIKRMGEKQSNLRSNCWRNLSVCALPLVLVGCGSLKKAALVGGATTVAAGAASALSSGVLVPAVTGGLTASVTSVIADQMHSSPTTERGGTHTVNNCAPDNFWTLLGDLVSMGGWLLILVILAPMVLGWILPGPLERKKKQ